MAYRKIPAPNLLPHVLPEMNHPDFWLNLINDPENCLLSHEDILQLNQQNLKKHLIYDLFSAMNDPHVLKFLQDSALQHISLYQEIMLRKDYFNASGQLVDKESICQYAMFSSLAQPTMMCVQSFTNERLLASNELMSEEAFDLEFDQLQNNGLDRGTLCLAVAESLNAEWVFQINESTMGWVEKKQLLEVSDIQEILQHKKVLVVQAYAPIYHLDNQICIDHLRMGTRLFVSEAHDDHLIIICPHQNQWIKARIRKEDTAPAVQNITSSTLLQRAFRWMHTPYGWGDYNRYVDCSKLIQCLFASFGLILPRNGITQGQAGKTLYSKEDTPEMSLKDKSELLSQSLIPGLSLIRFPGHIMLYIGTYQNQPYVLHALYKYLEPHDNETLSRVCNRVLVSDLALGADTPVGSFLERTSQALSMKVE